MHNAKSIETQRTGDHLYCIFETEAAMFAPMKAVSTKKRSRKRRGVADC
jgi:hypothetical protein